jgi:hypothetical protein
VDASLLAASRYGFRSESELVARQDEAFPLIPAADHQMRTVVPARSESMRLRAAKQRFANSVRAPSPLDVLRAEESAEHAARLLTEARAEHDVEPRLRVFVRVLTRSRHRTAIVFGGVLGIILVAQIRAGACDGREAPATSAPGACAPT